jgi:hypothetical protein
MFTFLSPQTRAHADPLQSRKTASAWFGHLSAVDVLTRQQHVVDAFDAMRRSWTEIDRHRISAIAYIDQSFEPEHRRLVHCYLDHLHSSPNVAARFRQAAIDANQAFLQAYQAALDPVCACAGQTRWKPLIPLIIIRLVHCLGVDAKLKLFHQEQWIPARWSELHRAFLRATELDIESVPVAAEPAKPLDERRTIEQEYIHALLIHRLDTGNLSAAEIEWGSAQLREWSRGLRLSDVARTAGGFYVDLAGTRGLVRRNGNAHGVKVGYLDTADLVRELEAAATLYPQAAQERERRGAALAHLATIEKLRPALLPRRNVELRRHARDPVDLSAEAHVRFNDIAAYLVGIAEQKANTVAETEMRSARDWQQALRYDAREAGAPRQFAQGDDWINATPFALVGEHEDHAFNARLADNALAGIEQIEIAPPADGEPGEQVGAAPATPRAATTSDQSSAWRIKDSSAGGWRLFAPVKDSGNPALHSLLAIRPADAGDAMLAVVRRLHRQANQFEVGVALIGGRAIPVMLHARRRVNGDMSVLVDGIDISAFGRRFAALYVLPPSPGEVRTALRTLVIPASEYLEGRKLVLTTGRSHYTIVLGRSIEGTADWSWATMQIAGKTPRASVQPLP